jgi:hypothetical protein
MVGPTLLVALVITLIDIIWNFASLKQTTRTWHLAGPGIVKQGHVVID